MSASQRTKAIAWAVKGTATEEAGNAMARIARGVGTVSSLVDKVAKGEIRYLDSSIIDNIWLTVAFSGNSHVTKYKDGTEDPRHFSGQLGMGNLKRSNRATSFHFYPETGDLVFSNSKYPRLRISEEGDNGDAIPAHHKATDWVWDEKHQRYRYHDGQDWIWAETTGNKSGKWYTAPYATLFSTETQGSTGIYFKYQS